MSEVDSFIKDEFIPFRKRLLGEITQKHSYIFAVIAALLAGKKNKVGLQVMQNGIVAGEYTIHIDGVEIIDVESNKLESSISHPLVGIIKPYGIVELAVLKKAVQEEASFMEEPFSTAVKYLPDITIKFLR